ncbi:DNA topoisomerase VI subunit B [Verrucomicrobiota bacterium]
MAGKKKKKETAESMARKQREISVSEFFLKNRHLLGFDNPRKALLTTVKEAVDNALDACEEAGIVPEISVDIRQAAESRFAVSVTDNGPGILRDQIPRIFAKLLYGSKFHRLRMSRGQQGIGISAAGMYGQLTTGSSTQILSKTKSARKAHYIQVQIDTRKNKPTILKDEEIDPEFFPTKPDGKIGRTVTSRHGTCVTIEMEAAYVRGRLSVDEYLKQCAVVNPHLQLHYRVVLGKSGDGETADDSGTTGKTAKKGKKAKRGKKKAKKEEPEAPSGQPWVTFMRVNKELPEPPGEIKPHPHGVELGLLMQMLKASHARTLRSALNQDFSRVSSNAALQICKAAGLNPKAKPTRIAHRESEALFKAINETKLMRPPTDCLSPIGEDQIIAGLRKEISADFYTAVTRPPTVYRGNPFQIEVGLACAKPGEGSELGAEDPARIMRFANRVPLLYMAGACAISKAITAVKWKSYGLNQPRGSLPIGPVLIVVHMASVWVPFTSESKEAIAHYPQIIKEITFCLQECGRRLSTYLRRRHRQAETERKHNYMLLYIPHLAQGLKEILDLGDRQKSAVVKNLNKILEKTHLET